MKKQKKTLFSIFLMFATVVAMGLSFLSGCNKAFSFDGNFDSDEVMLCVDEVLDPSQYFSSAKPVTFEVSDESVLAPEEGAFRALKPGKATLFAQSGKLLIDQMQVYVKYSFLTPTNLKVDNDGILSWDSSAIFVDDNLVSPTYIIKVTLDGQEQEPVTGVEQNRYQFATSGNYQVSVMAEENERILASQYSQPLTFGFDLVTGVTEFVFNSEDAFGSQKGTFAWQEEGEAKLYVDGAEFSVDGNKKYFDFSAYEEGSVLQAKVSKIEEGKQSKSNALTVTKLTTPEVIFENNELRWEDVQAKHYLLNVYQQEGDPRIVDVASTSSVLQGLGEGVYSFSYQAIGKPGYANGNVKTFLHNIGKINNVNVKYELSGTRLIATFSTASENNKKFVVVQNGVETTLEFTEKSGDEYTLQHTFILREGKNEFMVQAIPTVPVLTQGEQNTSFILKSDPLYFDAYNLAPITNLRHMLVGEDNDESVLTFDEIEFADEYSVEVNGVKLESVVSSVDHGTVELKLGRLTKQMGRDGRYAVKVIVSRKQADGEITKSVDETKNLTMLSAPQMQQLGGEGVSDNKYTWHNVEDGGQVVASYKYKLFNVQDENFDTNLVEPVEGDTDIAQTPQLKAGYYVLQVRSLPLDEDKYLPSEDWAEDKFFYAQILQSAGIRIDKCENLEIEHVVHGYVLSIQTVQDGYKYEVFVDGTSVGAVYNDGEKEILYYEFKTDYEFEDTSKTYIVQVKVTAKDATQQKIHTESQPSVLNITKQKPFTQEDYSVASENLTVSNDDKDMIVQLTKDGNIISDAQAGEDATVDLSEYEDSFEIGARKIGYYDFLGMTTNGNVKLDSEVYTYKFHRSTTPTGLNYSKGQISFEHNDKVTKYIALVSVKSLNSQVLETKIEISTGEKTFDLEEKLAELMQQKEYEEFKNTFFQQKLLSLQLYAYISEEQEGVYYLPSRFALLKQDAKKDVLEIKKLSAVDLFYDEEDKFIFWEPVDGYNVTYTVYYNDVQQGDAISASQFDINKDIYNFSVAGDYKFYVVAQSDNALMSEKSKQIVFHKIMGVEALNVFMRGDSYFASFNLVGDLTGHITKVFVNTTNIIEGLGAVQRELEFELNDESFDIYLEGENFVDEDGNRIYYISSDTKHFDLKDLSKIEFTPNINVAEGKITWSDLIEIVNEWTLANPSQNVAYNITISNGEKTITVKGITQNSLSLDNEGLLSLSSQDLESGQYTITLGAYIMDYRLGSGGTGYYGSTQYEGTHSIKKLDAVTQLSSQISLDNPVSIEAEYEKDITLSWQYSKDGEQVFEIYVNDEKVGTATENTYTLKQSLLSTTGTNVIKVYVNEKTNLRSEAAQLEIFRFDQVVASLDDNGDIKITPQQDLAASEGYIIGMTVKSQTKYFVEKNPESLNIQNYLGEFTEKDGLCTIKIIHKATSQIALPCTKEFFIEREILAKPTVTQKNNGFMLGVGEQEADVVIELEQEDGELFTTTVEYSESGMFFEIPEDWNAGRYEFVIYCKKAGYLDSYKKEKYTFDLTRISNIDDVVFSRQEDGLDYKLSWTAVDNAEKYHIEVWNEQKLFETDALTTEILLSELTKWTQDKISGDFKLRFTTISKESGQTNTNSHIKDFEIYITPNTVENITISSTGEVLFNAQDSENQFHIVAKDAAGNKFVKDISGKDRKFVIRKDDVNVTGLSGLVNLSIVQLGSGQAEQHAKDGKVMLDSLAVTENLYKLQDVMSVTKNATDGVIEIKVANEQYDGRAFYVCVEINGEVIIKKIEHTKLTEQEFSLNAIEICNAFPELEEGQVNFKLFSVAAGALRSEEIDFEFNFEKQKPDLIKQEKISETEEYLIINLSWKDSSAAAGVGANDDEITKVYLLVRSDDDERYVEVDIDKIKGYWLTDENLFTLTKPEGAHSNVYGLNISQLLGEYGAGQIFVEVGFVKAPYTVVSYGKEYEYQKLSDPSDVNVSEGNITWSGTSDFATTYILYFENELGEKSEKVSSSAANFYRGEDIIKSGDFYVAVQAGSTEMGVLSSQKIYYLKDADKALLHKLTGVSADMHVFDGIISMDFDWKKEEANENTIEGKLANTNPSSWLEWAEDLLNSRLSYPFDFKPANISTLKLNLKFVSTSDKQTSYLTSVNALDVLSMLKEETRTKLTAIQADASGFMTLKAILGDNKNFFNGVASNNLLFDEIGEGENGLFNIQSARLIPAGNYDIYVQQQGSDEEISSSFKLALENRQVLPAPKMFGSSEVKSSEDDTSNYYINFVPIEGYDNYTLRVKILSGKSVAYSISKHSDGNWFRSSFSGEEVSLGTAISSGDESYVKISLNDPNNNGLIFETGIKDIFGDEAVFVKERENINVLANIYINGDGKEEENKEGDNINGKSNTITCHFLYFDISSLRMQNGNFAWRGNNLRPTAVRYKHSGENAATKIIYGSDIAWSPSAGGQYDFVKFMTRGFVEENLINIWVDSPVYTLEDVYKLSAPNMNVKNGVIEISAGIESGDARTTKGFVISNNTSALSLTIEVSQNEQGLFRYMHSTGVNKLKADSDSYAYALTEQNAETFYASVCGDTVYAVSTESDGSKKVFSVEGSLDSYTINVSGLEGNLLLESDKQNLDAKKLTQNVKDLAITIQEGNLDWTSNEKWEEIKKNLSDGQELVFEVEIVPYYAQTNELVSEDVNLVEKFYTTSTNFNAEKIKEAIGSTVVGYVINIRANVYLTQANTGESITTMEGETLWTMTDGTYNDGQHKILEGELMRIGVDEQNLPSQNSLIKRAAKPENFKTFEGELSWQAQDESMQSVVYKVAEGNNEVLVGTSSNTLTTYRFTPSEENDTQLVSGNKYSFGITVYKENQLRSPITYLMGERDLQLVPILPNIDAKADYITDGDNNSNYTIDFTPYFERIKNDFSQQYVYITLSGDVEGGEITSSSAKANIIVPEEGNVVITARAKIKGEYNSLNSYKNTIINLSKTEWSNVDNFYFDPVAQIFHWTYGARMKTASSGAQIFVDGNGKPLGIEQGKSGQILAAQTSVGKFVLDSRETWPVIYNGAKEYVKMEETDIVISGNEAMVTPSSRYQNIKVYLDDLAQVPDETSSFAKGQKIKLDMKSWKITTQYDMDSEPKDYYFPLQAITTQGQLEYGTTFTVADNFAAYTDEDCLNPISVPAEQEITKVERTEKGNYLHATYLLGEKQLSAYLDVKDVVYFSDEETGFEDIFFKVTMQTKYSYPDPSDTRSSYSVDTTRQYNNVPISNQALEGGEEFDGIKVAEGSKIYVSSFQPDVSGEIVMLKIQARKGQNNLLSSAKGFGFDGNTDSVQFNLFGTYGEGSSTHPYQISNATTFENIKYRLERQDYQMSYHEYRVTTHKRQTGMSEAPTREDKDVVEQASIYNFKQTENLTFENLEGFKLGTFSGLYDGNGKNLTVSISNVKAFAQDKNVSSEVAVGTSTSATTTTLEFSEGAALFEEVSAESEIKNLNLSFVFDYNNPSSNKNNALVSGIAARNYGKISAIRVISSGVSFSTKIPSGASLAVAPIVGMNSGTMEDISSSANVSISNTFGGGSQNFYYGGLLGFNMTRNGTVTYAINTGNIAVSFSSNSNGSVNVGGVNIATTQQATTEVSMNSGAINVTCTSGMGVGAGVTLFCKDATFNYNVNTGAITAQRGGGLMFYFLSTRFGNLGAFGSVNMPNSANTDVNLIAIDGSQGTASATSFTTALYRPNTAWKSSTLPAGSRTLSVRGKYSIRLTRTGDEYSAEITKS